jgi:hypothetical protein
MALPRMTQRVLSRARVYVYDLTSDQEDRRPDNLRRAVAWLLLLFGEAVKFTQNPASRTLLTFRLARKRRSGLRSGAGIENSEWHGLPSAGFFRTCLLVPPSRIPFARAQPVRFADQWLYPQRHTNVPALLPPNPVLSPNPVILRPGQ